MKNSTQTTINLALFFVTVLIYNALFFNMFDLNRSSNTSSKLKSDRQQYANNGTTNFIELAENRRLLDEDCKF